LASQLQVHPNGRSTEKKILDKLTKNLEYDFQSSPLFKVLSGYSTYTMKKFPHHYTFLAYNEIQRRKVFIASHND
jgi:hypothetical protein